jgi:hypothetical protein
MIVQLDTPDPSAIRDAIVASLPADTSEPLPDQQLFLPWTHQKALQLDCSLVIGARGVGKTAWATALLASHDDQPSAALLRLLFPHSLRTVAGFSDRDHDSHPPTPVFDALMRDQVDPYNIWLAIVLRSLQTVSTPLPKESWAASASWVGDHLEEAWGMVSQANQALGTANTHQLFVFDALDRVSRDGNWLHVSAAIKALLRLVLELKNFKYLHVKVFLRTDQYNRGSFADLPDIAKIRATRVELLWSLIDLHALLWQCLCNGPPSATREAFRTWCLRSSPASLFGSPGEAVTPISPEARWELPLPVQQEESVQRQLFERLAGRRMGSGTRRGVPYTWIVNHLADAQGQATPRSFLTAIRKAAEESIYRFGDTEHPLHYEGLKRGVQVASTMRIDELKEDHPWLPELMRPFSERRSLVPFIEEVFEHVLNDAFGSVPEGVPGLADRLPKDLRNQGIYGLTTYLAQLGLLTPMQDHRLNMPDIYRIGFKLGRRGGIKPVPRTIAQPD